MKIKHEGRSGSRSICICKNCGEQFSELNIKIRAGGGKFCSNECYQQYRKRNKKDEKELNKLYQKKTKYGLSKEQYLDLFKKQDNKCAICGKSFNETKACVDHNHNTGNIRGLLCTQCNSLLGMAHDNINILKNAILYLESTSLQKP